MTTAKEREVIQEQFQARMNEDELLNCMRCGFCLPACPTYKMSGYKESHTPRGRIAMMKAVVDGLIEPDEDFERSLELCLGCLACESVCPSGVKYGQLLEDARDIVAQNKKYSLPVRMVRKTVFDGLFPHPNRMKNMTGLLGFYQRSGLQSIARKIGFLGLIPEHLALMEKVLPELPSRSELRNRPEHLEPVGMKTHRVAFFSGCLMDSLFLKTNDATMKLMQLAGCEIVIPQDQTCCGALHGHYGEKTSSKDLAKRNISAFEELNVDFIITNAGGCGGFLVDYGHLLKDEPEWVERAKNFSNKIKDISEILVAVDFHKKVKLELPSQIITYQDSCHLRNVMKTEAAPRTLLRSINGAVYQEMNDAGHCCGSAGIYNIIESEMSMKMLDYKMEQAKQTQAATIVTANPGCLLQMKLGIEKEGLSTKMRGVHIVDLLLEAVVEM
ncbi:(Fe-S)-binding protein [Neobacillus sp. LXY-1]|uniref:(Fe-S)-binding protein n=1 Tax=Neobacillus sp. LXY-1 TaxID=3379133 RepID=UPI003EE0DBF9